VQDKIVCYICIDLHDVVYMFMYLYVMTLSFNVGMICAKCILIVFIYFFWHIAIVLLNNLTL
jgi:hypothetical protein